MPRTKKQWNKDFLKYMDFIVNHPNYSGMPDVYKADGTIRWIASGNSTIGMRRYKWWDEKRKELGIEKENAWISKVARKIHPTGKKPCQICGKELSLDYIYPNDRGGFSPGAMSNAPDRLDGFHTYNLCCRSKEDTGRHRENLNRYGEDRRAYENWADGDWKAASWLMKEFNKHGVSPDHIGPISLGFSHNPQFNPVTPAENSAKNNRMTFSDVRLLLNIEAGGASVVSWHSKFIWDRLKNKVRDDSDALRLSKLMRQNMHEVLTVLSEIHSKRFDDFLIKNYLHPEYAFFSIEFIGFDPQTGHYEKMIKKPGEIKQYKNNAQRYIRISLESLDLYSKVGNRNTSSDQSVDVRVILDKIITSLTTGDEINAKKYLNSVLDKISIELSSQF